LTKTASQLSKNAPSTSNRVDIQSLDQWLGRLTFDQAYQQYEKQGWHSDDSQVNIPRPRKAFGVSAFWAIDDTTGQILAPACPLYEPRRI